MKQPHPTVTPEDAIRLLARSAEQSLTAEEESILSLELAAAYHMDEAAVTSREVQRIAEKIRARLSSPTLPGQPGA